MLQMKYKNLLIGGTLVGAFGLGAMFAPIGNPSATTEGQPVGKWPLVQTAIENETPQAEAGSFVCPTTGTPMCRGAGMGKYFAGTMLQVIADALGITVDELKAARSEGKSVADIAAEKGVKVDDIVAKMIEVRKATLEQLVKDGKITPEQMDAMLEKMEARMKRALERDPVGPMNGRGIMGGRGGCIGAGTGQQL
jgi:hypothetical protein